MAVAISRVARRPLIVLGVLLVTLAGLIVYNLDGSEQADPPAATSNPPRATRGRQPATTAQELDLRLETLSQVKPAPEESDRNPFRFRPPPPPPTPREKPAPPKPEVGEYPSSRRSCRRSR